MKNNSKLLVASVAMLLATSGAITASTVAWFSSTKSASLTNADVTVKNNQSNLIIKDVAFNNGETIVVTGEGTNAVSMTSSIIADDISGDGTDLYNPSWADGATGTNATNIDEAAVASYVDMTLTVGIAVGTTQSLDVFIGSSTAVTGDAAAATRVAFLDVDTNKDILWAPETEANLKYIVEDATKTDLTSAIEIAGYDLKTPDLDAQTAPYVNNGLGFTELESKPGTWSKQSPYIGTVSGNGTTVTDITLHVKAWLEGTDEQCVNALDGKKFSFVLDLLSIETA